MPEEAKNTNSGSEPVVELDDLLDLAVSKDASDVHFGAYSHIYLRINGKLTAVEGVGELSALQAERLIFQMLEPEEKSQFLKIKELDFSYQHKDGSVFRGNAYFRRKRVSVALRLIPKVIRTMDELGLPKITYDFVNAEQGLILITGPTGSGKSTTMAAMLEYMNQNQVNHVITIEDPIEYIFESKKSIFSQRELHTDTLSFRYALKSVLREDPDVVVISEMRDPETIMAAMMIAETGHLVFATLHTSGASQTVSRIVSAFPPVQKDQVRARLADNLLGVVSQRLLPLKKGGRVAAYEVMVNTPAIANIIRTGDTHQLMNAIQTGQTLGMINMEKSVYNLVNKGLVSAKEVEYMFTD